jgi:hypothetical protein
VTVATDVVGSVGLYVPRQPVVSEGYLSAVYLATADWRGLTSNLSHSLDLFVDHNDIYL